MIEILGHKIGKEPLVLFGGFGLMILLIVVLLQIFPQSNSKDSSRHTKSVSVGSTMQVSGTALLCLDRPAWDRFGKLAVARDNEGILLLVLEGRAFFLEAGTIVRVIDTHPFDGAAEVRVLNGEKYGLSGWVSTGFLR